MALDQQAEMAADEIDAMLARHETGVLTLAQADEPYATPVSYGYDSSARRFYLRLVSTDESGKRRFLEPPLDTELVVYEEGDRAYRSVIASGTLTEVPRDELTVEHIEQYGEAKRPLFEMWAEGKPDLDIRLYELDPDSLTGRAVSVDGEMDAGE